MANGDDKKSWKAYGEAAAGGGGGGRAVGGGSGGSDRIGNDLAKMHFLLKNVVSGSFLAHFGPSRPQKWIRLEISVLKMVERGLNS